MTIEPLPVPEPTEPPPGHAEIEPLLGGPPVLPDRFWESRPVLRQIRNAARARLVAPDALLGAVLARVCVAADWRFVLPPVVGRTGSLNTSIALAGRSGAGKGSVVDESAALLDISTSHDHPVGEAPAGSGEGIIRTFFDLVPDPDSERKNPVKVWRQARRGMLVRVDEAELLRALGQRSGQTTDQILRSAWSGEALGNAYVGESGDRKLAAHAYRLALLLSVQPEVARFLFDQAAGGTPQRLVWLAASFDPTAPDEPPEHPGRLHLRLPTFVERNAALGTAGSDGLRRIQLPVADGIKAELRAKRLAVLRGEVDPDPLDSHADLSRLKLAALLSLLDGRLEVLPYDWDLAGIIADTSRDVRVWMAGLLRTAERGRDAASAQRAGERAEAAEYGQARARGALARVSQLIGAHVHKHPDDDPCNRRCLRHSINSRDRGRFDGALGLAIEREYVVVEDGQLKPGPSRPADRR